MTVSNHPPPTTTKSWDAYWKGTGNSGAYSRGGANHPALLAVWNEFFSQLKNRFSKPGMVDIASGNGAVVERALDVFGEDGIEIQCVDISEAAISNISERFDSLHGVVANARSIPLPDAGFDIVTSQFGVEYAGLGAIDEALRLLAPGGQLGFVMHHAQGRIHQECRANLKAVNRLQQCEFLPLAGEMFRHGFEAVRGADRRPYDEAAASLGPAAREAEAIMKEMGERIADDTVARLYGDVARIHGEIQHYDPDEVLNWLQGMENELKSYAGRMSSMLEATIDEPAFETICARISGPNGLSIDQAGPLLPPDDDDPLAWVLFAHKAD